MFPLVHKFPIYIFASQPFKILYYPWSSIMYNKLQNEHHSLYFWSHLLLFIVLQISCSYAYLNSLHDYIFYQKRGWLLKMYQNFPNQVVKNWLKICLQLYSAFDSRIHFCLFTPIAIYAKRLSCNFLKPFSLPHLKGQKSYLRKTVLMILNPTYFFR